MKLFRLSLLTTASLGTLFLSSLTHAAAFQLYELGAPVVGTAGVGQAVADDASISYYNPAGMGSLSASQGMLGSQIILPHTDFSANSSNTISGNNGGNAGLLAPGLGGYFVYNFSPKLKFGVSLTQPFGGALDYNNHWVGRFNVQQMTFYTLNLNPSVAYQVNRWMSLGAGVSVEYANLNESVALPITPLINGQLTVKAANYAPGFNLGVLFTPAEATKVGVAFRSQIVHNLSGNVDFLNITATPSVSTRMTMPANVIASVSQNVTNQISLLGELGWANWSTMRDTIIHVAGLTASTPQNWNDTYRVGVGGQYKLKSPIMLQAGVSYDSSPTSKSKRLPELPMDRQIRIALGLEYFVSKAVTLGLSYEYINFGNASINNPSSNGVLAGSYPTNYANVLQASLNVKG